MRSRLLLLSPFIVLIMACSSQVREYESTKPVFVMEDYFSGQLLAWGMVQDYNSKMTRRFCVEIAANWQEKEDGLQGVVDERFYFDDGEEQTRVWRINKSKVDGKEIYTGEAGDVIGQAKGSSAGSAFHWVYKLNIPIGKGEDKKDYVFLVDDWIYLLDEKRAFNKSTLEKFGLALGELSIFFEKQDNKADCKA